jgi:hypothetical protein
MQGAGVLAVKSKRARLESSATEKACRPNRHKGHLGFAFGGWENFRAHVCRKINRQLAFKIWFILLCQNNHDFFLVEFGALKIYTGVTELRHADGSD